jgi:hypothetical protein
VASWLSWQGEKEERRRKKEEMAISAKIRLNFEKIKIWFKWW